MNKLLLVLVFCAAIADGQTAAGGNSGKDLYMKFSCYACHGFSGQNGQGSRLVPMRMTQEAFSAVVRKGRRQMPQYTAKALPDTQLGAIYAYIKTLPDLTPAARSLPQLNEILNQN